jgi:hypothetical protein
MVTSNIRSQLLRSLCAYFSKDELRTLCFEMEIPYEDMPGRGKTGKAREIIIHFESLNRIGDLVNWCRQQRPGRSWPVVAEIAGFAWDCMSVVTIEQTPAGEPADKEVATTVPPSERPAIQSAARNLTKTLPAGRPNPYQVGAPLPPGSPLYVERQADDQAWDRLQRMEYVLFVEPRQHGKTSLIHHLAARCGHNYSIAYLDMVNLDRSSEEAWYGSLGREILQAFAPVIVTHAAAIPASSGAWFSFLRELAEIACNRGRRLVIALDGVGAVPDNLATDFFATIRSVYVHRGGMECFSYLTFVISGARDPRDMIRDLRISDFNFERTRIADFTLEQVKGLLGPLNIGTGLDEVANRLYNWTKGQPYLCQRLCWFMAEAGGIPNAKSVDAAVDDLFLGDDGHLQDIIDELSSTPGLPDSLCRILNQPTRFVPAINRDHFRLAHVIGIVSPNKQPCQVRNDIYGHALLKSELCTSLPSYTEELRP